MSSRIPASSSRKTASLFKGDPKHLLIDEDVTVSTPAPRIGGLTPEVSHQQSNQWSSRGERLQLTPRQPVNLATEPAPRRPAPLPSSDAASVTRLPVAESRLRDSFRRTEMPDTTSPVFDKGYARTEVPAPEAPPLRIFVGPKDNQRVRMPIVNQIWSVSTVDDTDAEEENSGPTQRVSAVEESDGPSLITPRRMGEGGGMRSNGFQSGPWKPQLRPEFTMAENAEMTSGPITAAEDPSEEVSSKVPPAFALPRPSFSGTSDQNLFGGSPKRASEGAAPAPFSFEAPPEEQTSKLPMPTGFQQSDKPATKVGEVKPEVKPAAVQAPGSGRFVPVAIAAVFVVLGIVAVTKVQDGSLAALIDRASAARPAAAPLVVPQPAPPVTPAPASDAVATMGVPAPAPAAPVVAEPLVAEPVQAAAVEVVEAPPVSPPPVVEPVVVAPPPPAAATSQVAANPDDGILTITADVPARVWINGVDHGLAPISGLALAPGSYRVELKPSAGKGRAKSALVRVDPGRPKTVTFGLMKLK